MSPRKGRPEPPMGEEKFRAWVEDNLGDDAPDPAGQHVVTTDPGGELQIPFLCLDPNTSGRTGHRYLWRGSVGDVPQCPECGSVANVPIASAESH